MAPPISRLALAAALAATASGWCAAQDAPSLSDVAINLETVVANHIRKHSKDGVWSVKPGAKGKTLRLRFAHIDRGSIDSVSPGAYAALVRLREDGSRRLRQAEFIVDLGGSDWRVASVHWLGPDERIDYGAAAKRAAAAVPPRVSKAQAPRRQTRGSLPEVALTSLGGQAVLLTSCPAEKCLVAVLSPWCPHCRNAAANVISLRDYLKERGAATRVVIGGDSLPALRRFAAGFGDDALLDPGGEVPARGVPHFYTIYDGGGIIRESSGAPAGTVDPARWAEEMGLP
jgi:hypothetical protein